MCASCDQKTSLQDDILYIGALIHKQTSYIFLLAKTSLILKIILSLLQNAFPLLDTKAEVRFLNRCLYYGDQKKSRSRKRKKKKTQSVANASCLCEALGCGKAPSQV
jgi:hypothetical protein